MRFALRRLSFFALTLWVAVTLNFLLPRMMPGNPAVAMIAKFKGGVSPQALKTLETQFGVNTHQSIVSEYFSYLGNITTGKFGTSLSEYPASVAHIVLNAILSAPTLLITTIGTWILTMRNTMITTLAEDYVRMARAKGLSGRRIMFDYAARNAILPNLTGFAMSLGFVLGGAILIEFVFNYQGVGYWLLNAVNNEDYPLMQALFLLITVAVLLAILVADIATALLDPRTRNAR